MARRRSWSAVDVGPPGAASLAGAELRRVLPWRAESRALRKPGCTSEIWVPAWVVGAWASPTALAGGTSSHVAPELATPVVEPVGPVVEFAEAVAEVVVAEVVVVVVVVVAELVGFASGSVSGAGC